MNIDDLTGKRFGRLVVIKRGENKGEYIVVDVEDWIKNDDLLDGKNTY